MSHIRDREKEIEETMKESEHEIEEKIHHYNFLALMAGGMAVFFLMVSMVVAMPFMFYTGTATVIAHPYTPLQDRGRELYTSLGCFYCHSQFVRPQDWAIGLTSESGDFTYDQPHTLGTERTGPDLAQIGGMRPTIWHHFHDMDPRSTSPNSIMPNFDFLSDEDLSALIEYINYQGGLNLEVMAFQPNVPEEYKDAENPNMSLMMYVMQHYNDSSEEYTGTDEKAQEWKVLFELGKAYYTRNCLSCHGCSGNGQGPYARHVVSRPANLNERIANYPGDYFHFWRVSEGVPGTAMPPWKKTFNETTRWIINTYEMSFLVGSLRTVPGEVSDLEGDEFNNRTRITPPISGTEEEFAVGKQFFELYCAQCHGVEGQGLGPASNDNRYGFIKPIPANFTEAGEDFPAWDYGRYVWKVREGVETTNMPPWKYALRDDDIYRVIFYIQGFSSDQDYNEKWAPLYIDEFGRNLKR